MSTNPDYKLLDNGLKLGNETTSSLPSSGKIANTATINNDTNLYKNITTPNNKKGNIDPNVKR